MTNAATAKAQDTEQEGIMTFDTAERANEREEHDDYSALHDTDAEQEMIDNQIIEGYLDDAYNGRDHDWTVSDDERTRDAVWRINRILRSEADDADKIAEIRSTIYAVQAAAAADHLAAMNRNGRI